MGLVATGSSPPLPAFAVPHKRRRLLIPGARGLLKPTPDLCGAVRMLTVERAALEHALDRLGHVEPAAAHGRVDAMGRGERTGTIVAGQNRRGAPIPKPNDLSRSLTAFEQDSPLIVVIEMSQPSWLVAGIVPGVDREPLKKLEPNGDALLRLLQRWRDEATKAGR